MKVNIFYSNTTDNCIKRMLSEINDKDLLQNHVVITPDRRTLLAEQELFEIKEAKSFFNVNVTTFTRFSTQVLAESALPQKKILTKPLAVSIIKKIMLENKDSLSTFKKSVNYNGVASKFFETISMFKSCNITPEMVDTQTANNTLNNKLKDIKFVYEMYEDYLKNDYTDSFNRLNAFSELLNTTKFLDTNFYFLGFDDFTPQMYEIIVKLIKVSKSVNVACAASFEKTENRNIFLNNIYLNLLDYCKQIGVQPNTIDCKNNYEDYQLHLAQNLFAPRPVKSINVLPENKIVVAKFLNVANEVEYVAKTILKNIVDGKRFGDFSVIVPNINQYKDAIVKEFNKAGVPFYLDENLPFADHIAIRILFALQDMITTHFSFGSVVSFLKLLQNLPQQQVYEYERFIEYTGLNGQVILSPLTQYEKFDSNNFSEVYVVLGNVLDFSKKIKNAKTISESILLLQEFLQKINYYQMLEQLQQNYLQEANTVHYRLAGQVFDKLEHCFNELSEVFEGFEVNDAEVFFGILQSYLENISLSLPPIEHDTVFVADSVASFIGGKYDLTFVLGANEGKLPLLLDDLGIISDKDLNLLSNNKNKIGPTVAYINKRNRFLLYEKLLRSQNNYIISYLTMSSDGKPLSASMFVTGILQMFANKESFVVDGDGALNKFGAYKQDVGGSKDKILFNNISPNYALDNLINAVLDWHFYSNDDHYKNHLNLLQQSLSQNGYDVNTYLKNTNYKNKYENISNAKELFFAKSSTSVSQFEEYFKCPFTHFVRYGIKLQEKLSSELDFKDFGIIIHEFVALLLPILTVNKNQNLSEDYITDLSNKLFEQVKQNKVFEIIVKNPNNYFVFESLQQECLRIAFALHEQLQASSFVPQKPEYYFDSDQKNSIVIEQGETKIGIKGVVDRFDFYEDKFTVIDYKTGASNFNNFNELINGEKIQLFVYIKAIKNQFNKTCVGAFYMPLKNEFSTEKDLSKLYKLRGVISNNLEDIFLLDKNLKEPDTASKFLPVVMTKKGEPHSSRSKVLLSTQDIDYLSDFAIKLMQKALAEMLAGNITPNPLYFDKNKHHNRDEYLGLSNFNLRYGNSFRIAKTLKEFSRPDFEMELEVKVRH